MSVRGCAVSDIARPTLCTVHNIRAMQFDGSNRKEITYWLNYSGSTDSTRVRMVTARLEVGDWVVVYPWGTWGTISEIQFKNYFIQYGKEGEFEDESS